ncbi:MAG: photosynthetic complex assembly protein PuhC [Acetobacteraceae bacterium]|nr:photosynthetic complex assembly protein PuhC [Pseudomonadota bacterium]
MIQAHHTERFPRVILIAVGTAMVMSIMAAAAGRIWPVSYTTPTAAAVVSRDLLFRDMPDGGVAIYDAHDSSAPISIAAPQTNGFLRATMRTLASQRKRQDAGPDIPFRLTRYADGRLTLEDPTTHRIVEMEAFGIDNEKVFAALLSARPRS